MALTIKETANVLVAGNKGAFKDSAKRRAGKMLNDRLIGMIQPNLPLMVRGYADTELGRAAMANLLAGAVIHFGYKSEKLTLAADAMVTAAMDDFVGSFNIEAMINDLVDGVNLDGLKEASGDVRDSTATVLRKAADVAATA